MEAATPSINLHNHGRQHRFEHAACVTPRLKVACIVRGKVITSMGETRQKYNGLLKSLLSHEHVFYSPPTSPHKLLLPQQQSTAPDAPPAIASLSLHPVLESLLHILNCDLPAAHFLCRHAEVEPHGESMYVHGILHRIEGDLDNTRCWYRDVQDHDMFKHSWDEQILTRGDAPAVALQGWQHFLDRLERYRDRTRRRKGQGQLEVNGVQDWTEEERLLRAASLWEMRRALVFCEAKFGIGEVTDASSEFLGRIESGNEKHAKIAQNMITGGEGWRIF